MRCCVSNFRAIGPAAPPGVLRRRRGKPYLLSPPRDLRFNLSHARTGSLSRSPRLDIGVDVDRNRRAESMKLAERFFAREEADFLRGLERRRAGGVFRDLGVEGSRGEGDGTGARAALDSFVVSLEPPRVTMRAPSAPDWSAYYWRRGSFHFAVAAQGPVRCDFREVARGFVTLGVIM